ncbi:putative endoribonuclease L-PSP [Pelagophyceae sp. CCMP2097]|nr:putative endoribonuclease L-PSP [Pelagophyceae sp. CCMP2097]
MIMQTLLRANVRAVAFSRLTRGVHVEARIAAAGLTLPPVGAPKGSYALTSRQGNLLYLAGHLPQPADGPLVTGKVGQDLTVEEANAAAQLVALNICATLKAEVGDLDNIVKIHKLVGFVNCVDGFSQQPAVINGASDLLFKIFGEAGKHARSAVGTNALPLNVPVEIEAIVEIKA